MKTAISIPDETFERAERLAAKHGLKRSQFYAAAVERYADDLEAANVTALIDAVVDAVGTDDSAQVAAASARRRISEDAEQW